MSDYEVTLVNDNSTFTTKLCLDVELALTKSSVC